MAKRQLNVRLDDDLVAIAQRVAKERETTLTRLVTVALRSYLAELPPRRAGKVVRAEPIAEQQKGCPHPKDRERKHPYGVFCGACQKRLR